MENEKANREKDDDRHGHEYEEAEIENHSSPQITRDRRRLSAFPRHVRYKQKAPDE